MSDVSPLRRQFGARLRALIIASPRRQCELAAALNVSNSAISQMLTGKIIPRHTQLKVLCDKLNLSRDEELELTNMLLNIRNGEANLRSRFNQMFSAARRERGVSVEQLARLSGVPAGRLRLFENCYDAAPLVDEVNRLAPVLDCSAQDLLLAAGLGRPVASPSGTLIVSEPSAEYHYEGPSGRRIPVVELAALRNYRRERPLGVVAAELAVRQTSRGADLPVPTVAVAASARQLELGIGGEVLLLVSEELPPGYRSLELACDKDGNFRLRERRAGGRQVVRLTGSDDAGSARYAVWAVNVLEVIISPVRSGMMK